MTNDETADQLDHGTDRTPTCEFVSDVREDSEVDSTGITDDEVVHENGVVTCEADATHVIRPPGTEGLKGILTGGGSRKRVVCYAHAGHCQENAEREWEICGENVEGVIAARAPGETQETTE